MSFGEKKTIIRIGNSTNQKFLSTTVFRKSTHTDKYLDFQSHHPLAHKVAVACNLFNRADKICSDFPDLDKEKEHVEKVLQNNSYPRRLVAKNWRPPPCSQLPEQDPPTATVTLLYVCLSSI